RLVQVVLITNHIRRNRSDHSYTAVGNPEIDIRVAGAGEGDIGDIADGGDGGLGADGGQSDQQKQTAQLISALHRGKPLRIQFGKTLDLYRRNHSTCKE